MRPKRPLSVVLTLILLAVFGAVALTNVRRDVQIGSARVLPGLFFSIALFTAFALLMIRPVWGRVITVILLASAAALLGFGCVLDMVSPSATGKSVAPALVVPLAIFVCWFYWFTFGKASKGYFALIKKGPNQPPEPTAMSVTSPADAGAAPAIAVAHL